MAASCVYQVIIGYCIVKWLRGRRVLVQLMMLAVLFVTEIIQISLHKLEQEAIKDIVFMIQGQIVYYLMYTVCLLGPVDLAKIALLRENAKFSALFLGLSCFV